MTTDYLATLNELPPRHSGVLFEQVHQASLSATFYMRAMGLALPGDTTVPTQGQVYEHLCGLVNAALEAYFATQENDAPKGTPPDDIWGEDEDDLFWVCVTGLSEKEGDGFTVEIEFNLLYRN